MFTKQILLPIKNQIKGLLQLTIAQKFNEDTKTLSFLHKHKLKPEQIPEEWKTIYYKGYVRLEQILLPKPTNFNFNLYDSLLKRKSTRGFLQNKMRLVDFSQLLYYSAGIKKWMTNEESTYRFYPSAGARYPLEVYPVVLNVESLQTGLYHYHVKTHSLEKLPTTNIKEKVMKQFNQRFVRSSAVILLITAVFQRTVMKYKNRGLRHIYTEYGHLAQNIYLLSTVNNIGCCSIGGYLDDGLNSMLDIHGEDESVIGVIVLGSIQ